MDEDTKERIEKWQRYAERNTEKWGVQPPAHVILAIMEELAEITEDFLVNSDTPNAPRTPEEREMMYLLTEIISLGDYVQTRLDDLLEDENGEPVDYDKRPTVTGKLKNREDVDKEIDDIAPLIIQLAKSVDEYSWW